MVMNKTTSNKLNDGNIKDDNFTYAKTLDLEKSMMDDGTNKKTVKTGKKSANRLISCTIEQQGRPRKRPNAKIAFCSLDQCRHYFRVFNYYYLHQLHL
jgi:hypothetical protein